MKVVLQSLLRKNGANLYANSFAAIRKRTAYCFPHLWVKFCARGACVGLKLATCLLIKTATIQWLRALFCELVAVLADRGIMAKDEGLNWELVREHLAEGYLRKDLRGTRAVNDYVFICSHSEEGLYPELGRNYSCGKLLIQAYISEGDVQTWELC